MSVPPYLFWRFCSESTRLLLCCFALAREADMAAAPRAFRAEWFFVLFLFVCLLRFDWLRLLSRLAVRTFYTYSSFSPGKQWNTRSITPQQGDTIYMPCISYTLSKTLSGDSSLCYSVLQIIKGIVLCACRYCVFVLFCDWLLVNVRWSRLGSRTWVVGIQSTTNENRRCKWQRREFSMFYCALNALS